MPGFKKKINELKKSKFGGQKQAGTKIGQESEKEEKKEKEVTKVKHNPVDYKAHSYGIKVESSHAHKGWITMIKYIPDVMTILSSSLDGFIHYHSLDDLTYKEHRTFNLHQKGVNAFVYSPKHRFMASCGEERHIILWEPFTLGRLTDLIGHNTSVTNLDINEDRYHLISLGTDKVVRVWDTRSYSCLQVITDRFFYRPENILTSLHYDKVTHNIIVCSRKINFWTFKTQEEIKTSHEYEVTFALYNTQFDAVVSGDEGGYVNIYDVENGKLMSKFGDAHGTRNGVPTPITTGCFDMVMRRLITAGADGSVKIWNFSNGQCLKDLKSKKDTFKVDDEITSLISIADKTEKSALKSSQYFLGVGWGLTPSPLDSVVPNQSISELNTTQTKTRREHATPTLHIWLDDRETGDEQILC